MDCPNISGETNSLKTSSFYRTSCSLPKRFENPSWFYGYGSQQPRQHPFYRTTYSDYGRHPPSIHTVPTSFFPNNQEFTKALAKTGMYRNYSLNTVMDIKA